MQNAECRIVQRSGCEVRGARCMVHSAAMQNLEVRDTGLPGDRDTGSHNRRGRRVNGSDAKRGKTCSES